MAKGLLIAIEGGEGAGKTTQARELVNWLRFLHFDARLTREPGGTVLGEKIRALLLGPGNGAIAPRAEALLFAADRAQHAEREVRPAMVQGAVVVSDRYADSNIAYQGAGRFLGVSDIAQLSAWATGLVPDLTILLDVSPELGAIRRRGSPDRIEAEGRGFHDRVREAFLDQARANSHRYIVIDASQDRTAVGAEIRGRVAGLLARQIADLTLLDEPLANEWKEPPGEDAVLTLDREVMALFRRHEGGILAAVAGVADILARCQVPPGPEFFEIGPGGLR